MRSLGTRWLVVQHVPWEGPGLIGPEALARGLVLEVVHPYRGDRLPPASELSGLVLMGGPMSANDVSRFPFLSRELELVGDCLRRAVPVLGVCLGAQVLARALGGRVMQGETPEVGTGHVQLLPGAALDPLFEGLPSPLPVFHWHEETFELPGEAELLASSAAYRNQAFRGGECAYGLQFHVELDRELADAIAPHLPAGVTIENDELERLEVSGKRVISRFFDRALAVRANSGAARPVV